MDLISIVSPDNPEYDSIWGWNESNNIKENFDKLSKEEIIEFVNENIIMGANKFVIKNNNLHSILIDIPNQLVDNLYLLKRYEQQLRKLGEL